MIDFMIGEGTRQRTASLARPVRICPTNCRQISRFVAELCDQARFLLTCAKRDGFLSPEVDDQTSLNANRGGVEIEGGRVAIGLFEILRTGQAEIEGGTRPERHVGNERERKGCLDRECKVMATRVLGAEGAVREASARPEADLVIEREEVTDTRSKRER